MFNLFYDHDPCRPDTNELFAKLFRDTVKFDEKAEYEAKKSKKLFILEFKSAFSYEKIFEITSVPILWNAVPLANLVIVFQGF
jgi:hypothetical protein